MFGLILTALAVLSLLVAGLHAVVRQRSAANFVLLSAFVQLAGIEIAGQLSLQPSLDFSLNRWISLLLESFLPATFMLLSLIYGRSGPFVALTKLRLGLVALSALFPPIVLIIAGDNFAYSPDFQYERILFLGNAGYWYYLGVMVSFVISLANVEATFVAMHGMARNRMKFEAFGIMSLLAVLIFYYSQGLLYRTINMNLFPVRSSVFIIASLMIVYSQAFRGGGARVSISRYVLYRSVALWAVGCYVLGLGLIGEGMRYFGANFGRNVIIVFAFSAGVLLLAVFFSEKARRRTKVYINKHFFAHKHDYREEWIKFTNRLSSCATLAEVEESVLTAYEETFGLAGASLYLPCWDEKKYVRALTHSMPEGMIELSLSKGLREYFIKRERVLNLNDAEYRLTESERAIFTQAWAWLVVPLISNGKIEGIAALRKQIVPEMLSYDDFDLMKVMARQAAQAVANLRLSEELMETRSMAAVSRISTFVIHDLKNLTSGLSLVVENAEEHIGNPEFQKDAIATVSNTLGKMKNLMQRLKFSPEKTVFHARAQDIDCLSRETVAELARTRPDMRITYSGAPAFSSVDGEEIKKVIVNLVQNAVEASGEQRTVTVEMLGEADGVRIKVTDAGCGMTEEYMKNHLFKPFRTTREKGLGIGLYQCRQIVEAHGGGIEVKSKAGRGTTVTVLLPCAGEYECVVP